MKYIRKGVLELYDKELVDKNFVDNAIIETEVADEDTTISTQYGDVVVSKGNYIVTNHDGSQIGMTWQDLRNQFDEA